MRFNASTLRAEAARAIEISPTRSTWGTRRSRAAISSCNSRIVCARMLSALADSGVNVATAVLAQLFGELDSRSHRSENNANSCSRLEPWRPTRVMLTCRMDMFVASSCSRSCDG